MSSKYTIHPAIGIARVGNSETDFYLAPETPGGLPTECDVWGNEKLDPATKKPIPVQQFKNGTSQVKRQAARFKVYVTDAQNPEGRELQIGDNIQGIGSHGKLMDIQWTAYVANKKACWYQFKQLEGEHGYSPTHPLRNAEITDPTERQKLIIDPGPQTIIGKRGKAEFSRGQNPGYAQIFPPPLLPNPIDTLGEIRTNDAHNLIVLGGLGKAGSYKTEFGQPRISGYSNNPGWYDDISDGPITAFLVYWDELDQQVRYTTVEDPAWVLVGYPAYAPEIQDMVTMDEVIGDLAIHQFASDTYLYGTGNFDNPTPVVTADDLTQWRNASKRYNSEYYPYFYRDIWPILSRPFNMQWVTSTLAQSNQPHNTGFQGNFQEDLLAMPPQGGVDPYAFMRQKIYASLRKSGQENVFSAPLGLDEVGLFRPLMPLLLGDNPLTNVVPSKFLHLTDTMIFMIKQWMEGKFINEKLAGIDTNELELATNPGLRATKGVLSNGLGGAFNPGAEVAWIIRNPAIYSKAYRIKTNMSLLPQMQTSGTGTTPGVTIYQRPGLTLNAPISDGLEPGDLTKYSALPWQADFNECSNESIDVTYEAWNVLYDEPTTATTGSNQKTYLGLWWPSHRPMEVQLKDYPAPVSWAAGIPQNNNAYYDGDFKMVENWNNLGFLLSGVSTGGSPGIYQQERNDEALGSQKEHKYPTITAKSKKK